MFTIKHVTADGHERLWTARNDIQFSPRRQNFGQNFPEMLIFTQPNGIVSSIDRGSVYIINAEGKTVARYHLNADSPAPIPDGHPGQMVEHQPV